MNEIFGIINIDKPKGFTSHDVVARLRKILKTKKIGHTGTLDPMATGVLPICIGKATKVIQYLEGGKAYRAYVKLGIITDTYDIEGNIIESNPVKLDLGEVKEYLNDFKGEIKQKPPMYSAVHYKGKRLYEYARKNIEIEDIPERTIFIDSIELIEVLEQESENPVLVIDVSCSAGTYIRSIAYDLGKKLGCGATLSGLIRTKAGKLTLDTVNTLEQVQKLVEENKLNEILINPAGLIELECCSIDPEILTKVKNGQYLKFGECKGNLQQVQENQRIKLVCEGQLAAIAEIKENRIYPINVFI